MYKCSSTQLLYSLISFQTFKYIVHIRITKDISYPPITENQYVQQENSTRTEGPQSNSDIKSLNTSLDNNWVPGAICVL